MGSNNDATAILKDDLDSTDHPVDIFDRDGGDGGDDENSPLCPLIISVIARVSSSSSSSSSSSRRILGIFLYFLMDIDIFFFLWGWG